MLRLKSLLILGSALIWHSYRPESLCLVGMMDSLHLVASSDWLEVKRLQTRVVAP